MEFLLTRYRNLTALLLVILAQLVLLAYQVKSNKDVRLIRVWSVTAVTPLARVLEFVREHTIGVAQNYFVLVNVRDENLKLKDELGKLKLENQFLRNELSTADRAQALAAFQHRTPSRTLPARIIGTGTGANSRVVYIDQGSTNSVLRGMAVVTPDGIVGKVLASFPTASQVLLITDPAFAAGVISQKNRVHGTLKGVGQSKVIVDYVQNEEKVEQGEMFYTSGDDRIFPKGMPVGTATVVRQGKTFKEIYLVPAAFQNGLEEVLVVIEGIHASIPDAQAIPDPRVAILPPPPDSTPKPADTPTPTTPGAAPTTAAPAQPALTTEADRIRDRYKRLGETQGITYGQGGRAPNFNANPDAPKPVAPAPSAAKPSGPAGTPPASQPGATAPPAGAQPPAAAPRKPTAPATTTADPRPTGTQTVQPRTVSPQSVAPSQPR